MAGETVDTKHLNQPSDRVKGFAQVFKIYPYVADFLHDLYDGKPPVFSPDEPTCLRQQRAAKAFLAAPPKKRTEIIEAVLLCEQAEQAVYTLSSPETQ